MDVRVLAATNEPLQEKIEGEDVSRGFVLSHQRDPDPIAAAARAPVEDIPLLVAHFVTAVAQRQSMAAPHVSDEVMEVFKAYRWPGNVRELQNALERACALHDDGVIELKDLPERILEDVGVPVPVRKTACAAPVVDEPEQPVG